LSVSNRIDLTRYACPSLGLTLGAAWLFLTLLLMMELGATIGTFVACGLPGLLIAKVIWCEALLRDRNAIVRLYVRDNRLVACCRNGQYAPVTMAGSSRLFARVALLKLRRLDAITEPATQAEEAPCRFPAQILILNLPLCRNVDAEEFRRLRLWLRFTGATTSFLTPPAEAGRHSNKQ
jgi:hypothetical protein